MNGGAKTVAYKLAQISGFSKLPPYFSLGFHYSKWEPLSTDKMISLMGQFHSNSMPVDVYWMDIDYTKDNKYFEFD